MNIRLGPCKIAGIEEHGQRESQRHGNRSKRHTAIARVVEMVYDLVLEISQLRYMHCLHLEDQEKPSYQRVGWLALAVIS